MPPLCEKLSGRDKTPLRHQVTDISEIKPFVIEYQRHRLACTCCGVTTCGEIPAGVPTGMSGMRLVALATTLMAVSRQSKGRTSLYCELALRVSPGLIVNWQNMATAATRPAYDKLVSRLPEEKSVNVDETPTRQANTNAWIWTVVTSKPEIEHLGTDY